MQITSIFASKFEVRLILEHLLKLLVLDFPVARVVNRPDQLLDINRQFELLLDDPDEDLAVDVSGLVGRPSDGGIGVEGDLVVFAVDLALAFLLVEAEDLVEGDEAGVVVVQLGDQFAELEFFEVDFQSLQGGLQIEHAD